MNDGLHNLSNAGRAPRKRLGRGTGTGLGTTAGRGTKGQNARSGGGVRPQFEGGHTPTYRLLPKLRGIPSRFIKASNVSVGQLEAHFSAGDKVTRVTLIAKKLVHSDAYRIKLLSNGEIKKSLKVMLDGASADAKRKIEAAGGTIVVPHKVVARAVVSKANKPIAKPAVKKTPTKKS